MLTLKQTWGSQRFFDAAGLILTLPGVAFVAALALAGCGPIEYINQVTRQASSDVEAATAAKAKKWAPYYYTLAVEYLRKAREEAAYADFEAANRFGVHASKAAQKALQAAVARAADPARARRELAPDAAERKEALKAIQERKQQEGGAWPPPDSTKKSGADREPAGSEEVPPELQDKNSDGGLQ